MALKTFKALDNHGVEYWADYGTLLGIIRGNDIILHDNDVDVCLFDTPGLAEKLRKVADEVGKDYHLEYHSWGAYRIVTNSWKLHVDMYLVKKENGMYIDPTGKIPVELVGRRKKINWLGVDVSVPEKPIDALVWRYGKSWRTPQMYKDAVDGDDS